MTRGPIRPIPEPHNAPAREGEFSADTTRISATSSAIRRAQPPSST